MTDSPLSVITKKCSGVVFTINYVTEKLLEKHKNVVENTTSLNNTEKHFAL